MNRHKKNRGCLAAPESSAVKHPLFFLDLYLLYV